LDAVRPKGVVLVEGETWPNFVWTCKDRGIPVVLANARVSPRSASRYESFAPVVRSVTRHLDAVGVQHTEDARIWKILGIPSDKIFTTGSVKFDPESTPSSPRDFRPLLRSWGIAENDPVLVAGSTHPGEEQMLAESLRVIRKKHPRARLLIAPRHTERTAEVLGSLGQSGFKTARRTAEPSGDAPDILVIDTTGELRDWYACADVVFVGKSLAGTGGQNPVEAILAGRPVLFGPHMENFAALARELVSAGGAIEIRSAEELGREAGGLLGDPGRRTRIAARGIEALAAHRGATARTGEMVENAVAKG
jgi:3-deoxy-D-manno-octulosonic-acid transferase